MSVDSCSAIECEPSGVGGAPPPAGIVRAVARSVASSSAHQAALSVVDQGVVSATSFLTSVIVARATSREDLGVYYLALTLVLLARGVQTQILTAPYLLLCQRRQGDELAAYRGSVIAHQLGFGALAALLVLGLAGALGWGLGPAELAPAAWVLVAAMPLLLLRELHRHFLISHLKMSTVLALDAAAAVLQVGVLLLLWRLARLRVAGAYAVMGGAAAVVCLAWFLSQRGQWRIQRRRIAADWIGNWSFGRWALASHLTGCATPYVMPWLVATAAGQGAAGLYGACGALAGLANVFVMGLTNYLAPRSRRAFANDGKAALCRILCKGAAAYAVVVGGLSLLCLVLGEHVVIWVYDGSYAGGGMVLTLLTLSLLGVSMQIIAGNGLWAIRRPKATFVPDVCALLVTLGTAVAAIGPLGATGAALAGLAGATTGALLKTSSFLHLIRSVPSETVPSTS